MDKTDNTHEKYNKGPLGKIMEVPFTERSNIVSFEPSKLKQSKSRSRYDNEILSSNEKDYSQQYKRQNKNNSRVGGYTEQNVKRSKEEYDIIKSLAKDDFNPFLFNGRGEAIMNHEYSEKVSNKKMFSRVAQHLNEKQNEKSSTGNMKEQLEIMKKEKRCKKSNENLSLSNSGKWNKKTTPNAEGKRGMECNDIYEEYGTKIEDHRMTKEKMVLLKDMQKDYKSSQNNPKSQFNRYTSNKHHKNGMRRPKNDGRLKENDNTVNDAVSRKIEGHKGRPKKTKTRKHKKKVQNTSF